MEFSRARTNEDINRITELFIEQGKYHTNLYSKHRREPSFDEVKRYIIDNYIETDVGRLLKANNDNGEIVGFCALAMYREKHPWNDGFDEFKMYIDDLFIDERYRGNGVGREFMDYIKKYARQCGCKHIELMCAMNNHSALNFYKKNNFSATRERFLMRTNLIDIKEE